MSSISFTNGSGSWTCPAGVSTIQIECWGGGGCGKPYAGGGGGGGGYARVNAYSVTAGNSYTYSVGGGGVNANGNADVADAGGTSSFNSTVCQAGGGGGAYNDVNTGTPFGGVAGVGFTGDVLITGQAGQQGGACANGGPGNGGPGGDQFSGTWGVGYNGLITLTWDYVPGTPQSQTFTNSGTWTCPSRTRYVQVQCWGGGANGGSGGGTGGVGGDFAQLNAFPVAPGTTYNIVIGTTGSATNTTFNGSSCIAKTGGVSGSSVGDIKYSGGAGGAYYVVDPGPDFPVYSGGGGGGAAGTDGPGSAGGNSPNGGSGGSAGTGGGSGGAGGKGSTSAANAGQNGNAPGGGGGGGGYGNGHGASGGSGASGQVVLSWIPNNSFCVVTTT